MHVYVCAHVHVHVRLAEPFKSKPFKTPQDFTSRYLSCVSGELDMLPHNFNAIIMEQINIIEQYRLTAHVHIYPVLKMAFLACCL